MRSPALYRVAQFFGAVRAYLPGGGGEVDHTAVAAILTTPAQRRLFARMSPNDRRHALAVATMLQQAGCRQPALLQAALLHDVGKSLGMPISHRVMIVLLEAFWPRLLHRLAAGEIERAGWWRRPFIIHARHAAIGAAWAERAGCLPLAVRLIARHQDALSGDDEEARLLAALQEADNAN